MMEPLQADNINSYLHCDIEGIVWTVRFLGFFKHILLAYVIHAVDPVWMANVTYLVLVTHADMVEWSGRGGTKKAHNCSFASHHDFWGPALMNK